MCKSAHLPDIVPGFLSGSTMYSHGELGTYLNINCPENTQEYNSVIGSTRSEATYALYVACTSHKWVK